MFRRAAPYVFMIICAGLFLSVLGMFLVMFVTMEFGTETVVGRTEPGQYGCYLEKTAYEFYGIVVTDEDKVCPFTETP